MAETAEVTAQERKDRADAAGGKGTVDFNILTVNRRQQL